MEQLSGNGVQTTELTVRFLHPRFSWGPAILKVWRDDHTHSTKTNIKEKQQIFDILHNIYYRSTPLPSPTNTEAINLHRDHRATYIPYTTYTDRDSLSIDAITPDETKQPPPPLSTPRYGQAYKDKEPTTLHYYTKTQTKLRNMEMN